MGFRFFITASISLFMATTTVAAVSVTQTGGSAQYSRRTGLLEGDQTTTTTTVIGGVSGVANCASPSSTSTCNSCTASGATLPCNSNAVHDDLILEITFVITGSGTTLGQLAVGFTGTVNVALSNLVKSNTNTNIGDGTYTVGIPWEEICEEVFGAPAATGCASPSAFLGSSPTVLQIGLDTNNDNFPDDASSEILVQVIEMDPATGGAQAPCNSTVGTGEGACNFIAFPGDKKVFIEDVMGGSSFPDAGAGDSDITTIRVFRAEHPTVPTFQTTSKTDLSVASSETSGSFKKITLGKNEVDGLDNEKTYVFAIGSLDAGNNLGYVLTISDTAAGSPSGCFDTSGDASEGFNCHVASPADVIGLIEENPDCFISSATYGSPYKPEVKVFRKFRNQFLHPTWIGQKIIRFYYRNSPPLANWLRAHPNAQPIVRAILYPFWLFAKACLHFPWTVILSLASLLGLVVFRKRIREAF